jgi:hypothetical protein
VSFGKHRQLRQKRSQERILYIITSIAEYDNGRRETVRGYNRFTNTLAAVARESVSSMVETGYDVDVYLIAHYNVTDQREAELRAALPDSVGLEIWSDATPLGYARENSVEHVMPVTRGLSRQHRYVIKDKIFRYDVFVCFEDDMLIRGPHVQHYVSVTDELWRLRKGAPERIPAVKTFREATERFYGPMTERQLARMTPGFTRVEAALPKFQPQQNNMYEQIPVDYQFHTGKISSVDPSICCHVSNETANEQIPAAPDKDQLFFWETSIDALGVRKMPDRSKTLDWVLLLGGNNMEVYDDPMYVIGDYWSGRDGYFRNQRPDKTKGRYFSNQGGWMATRRQILEWHIRWCRGGFLP